MAIRDELRAQILLLIESGRTVAPDVPIGQVASVCRWREQAEEATSENELRQLLTEIRTRAGIS